MILISSLLLLILACFSVSAAPSPRVEDNQLVSFIDDAIYSNNFIALRSVSSNPNFGFYITPEHVSRLFENETSLSVYSLELLIERGGFRVLEYIQENFEDFALDCIPNQYEKFSWLWTRCPRRPELNQIELFPLLYKIASFEATEFLDFIVDNYSDGFALEMALNNVSDYALEEGEMDVVDFIENYVY